MKRTSIAFLLVASLTCLFVIKKRKEAFAGLALEQLTQIADEIISIGEFHGPPDVDSSFSQVSYVRSTIGGRQLFSLDVNTKKESSLTHTNEIVRTSGYSDDDKYLLLQESLDGKTLIKVYDRENSRFVPIDERPVKGGFNWLNVDNSTWLNSNAFAVNNLEKRSTTLITLNNTARQTARNINGIHGTSITRLSSTKAAMVHGPDVWILDFETKEAKSFTPGTNKVKSITSGQFLETQLRSDLQWLNYCESKNEFLVCSWDDSNYRHLFRLHPQTTRCEVTQLTFDDLHTYNGRWVQNGEGVAFVGNMSNHLFLAVDLFKSNEQTNLFLGGHVHGYCVSRDGNKIVAIASTNAEPLGIWEYNLLNKSLSYIGETRPKSKFSQILPRQSKYVPSFDGITVPYYELSPKPVETSKKYPAVIAIPPFKMQFFQAWERYSQYFANIGVFHFGVNHRGTDGYGKDYADKGYKMAYEDVMAAYRDIIKNPNVDRDKIFLMSFSGGSSILNDVIAVDPRKWAGIIVVSGAPPKKEIPNLKKIKMLFYAGSVDEQAPEVPTQVLEFKAWSETNGISVTTLIDPKGGHKITDTVMAKKLVLNAAELIFGKPK
jgi:dipeptidyl aminopeptidase/acylaminoacyl peptidase